MNVGYFGKYNTHLHLLKQKISLAQQLIDQELL